MMKRLSTIALFLATGATAAPGAVAADRVASPPVVLETTMQGSDLVIKVIGRAAIATEAVYTLEVVGGTRSSNRSVQRGRARLAAGSEIGLLTVRLAGAAREDWSVNLRVEPVGGEPYRVERTAAD